MAPTLPPALLTELGTARGEYSTIPMGGTDAYETTRELVWPLNIAVYDQMRRSDGQLAAILSSAKFPIMDTPARIPHTAEVREVVRATVEAELGLTLDDQGRRRTRPGGISWDETLRHALLKLDFGHSPMEQVYEPGPAEFEGGPPVIFHLKKLAWRNPRTLASIDVADDGGLEGIHQWKTDGGTVVSVPITVDSLVMFVNEREGADWAGKSILRASYKNWLIKDVLLRLAATAVDRTGMGLPIVWYPSDQGVGGRNDTNRKKALEIARQARTGDDAGIALEDGWEFKLAGVEGSTVDGLPWVKYHDEAAGRSALQMFLNLGHDNGARSLGDTFVDFFKLSEGALMRSIEEEFTEHVIRDFVRWNFGEDEPYPPLVFDELDSTSPAMLTSLAQLAKAGLISPDEATVSAVHRQAGLPAPVQGAVPAAVPAPGDGTPDPLHPAPAGPPAGTGGQVGTPNMDPFRSPPSPAIAASSPSTDEMIDRAAELVATLAALKARGDA